MYRVVASDAAVTDAYVRCMLPSGFRSGVGHSIMPVTAIGKEVLLSPILVVIDIKR